MTTRSHILVSISTLLLVSLVAAAVFRLEVEYHGWTGLIWIGYFHWAIPIGVALFCGWLALFADIRPLWKRAAFVISAALFAAAIYYPVWIFLVWHYNWFIIYESWRRLAVQSSIFALLPAIPLAFAGLAWLFGQRFRWFHLAASLALFMLASPLTMLLRPLFDHAGYNDSIHTIKSGCIVPFLMFALGLLFLTRRPQLKSGGTCQCGYDLRAHQLGQRCPECGMVIEHRSAASPGSAGIPV